MSQISVDFSKSIGIVKPMHCVNNGPSGSKVRATGNNFQAYANLHIPYARNHDASFYPPYGGEHTVDVHRIFKNFDADVNDPDSYDFEMTDMYTQDILSVGTMPYYRLGASIEHTKKYGTIPPKDFQKWAEICEHIIRHYNEGWADGFHYGIEYWEIWNEPDCRNADGSNPCWQGTEEQFVDFYATAFKHLKTAFPNLKIGGPAICFICEDSLKFIRNIFDALVKDGMKPDFFSYHGYKDIPDKIGRDCDIVYGLLGEYGWQDTVELHVNEWNYIRGWLGDDFDYSLASVQGLKGSAFTAATMCVGQNSHIDMMMYYDARPCGFNGLFQGNKLCKTYYTFQAFSKLYETKNYVPSESDDGSIYCTAAKNENTRLLMVTHYQEEDGCADKEVAVALEHVEMGDVYRVNYYLLDESHNLGLLRSDKVTVNDFTLYLNMPLHTTYLIEIIKA